MDSEETVQVHPRLPAWLVRWIDAAAARRGISQSSMIKVLLVDRVDQLNEPESADV